MKNDKELNLGLFIALALALLCIFYSTSYSTSSFIPSKPVPTVVYDNVGKLCQDLGGIYEKLNLNFSSVKEDILTCSRHGDTYYWDSEKQEFYRNQTIKLEKDSSPFVVIPLKTSTRD